MKKLISAILIWLLMMGSMMMAHAADNATIAYVFTGDEADRAGYAEGTVTLRAADGDYTLYWADDTAALDGWYPITKLHTSGGEASFTFGRRTAIPVGASGLIAVPEGAAARCDSACAAFILPGYKRLSRQADERRYRFAALSDIHIDCQDGGANVYYTNASSNFARALEVCEERKADFIVAAGDQITNASGATLEWLEYQRIIAESSFTGELYEAIGNHEMRYAKYSNCDVSCGIEEFIAATGLDGAAATVAAGKPYYALTEPTTGDHFIFMALERHVDPSEHDEFSDEQLSWVEDLLSRYSGDGHRIFLIQHSPISGYGAGDDREAPAYGGTMHTDAAFPSHRRFQSLIERYRDVIWLSGHTHVDFHDDVNFSDEDGASCLMFHIPSTAGTTRIVDDGSGGHTLDRTFYDDTSQGYLVDVYDDAVYLCGANLHDDKLYPAYTYIVGEPEGAEPFEAPTQPPTTPEPVYGDADLDGELTIFDVTCIQRHLAKFHTMSDEAIRLCCLDPQDDEMTIFDATLIQRKIARLIDRFPIEEQGLALTGASNIASEAKSELDAYFQYASYTAYADLKRACQSGDTALISAALSAFRELRSQVCLTTVYFSDANDIGNLHAYLWNSATGKTVESWPGQKPTFVRKNSLGQNIYAVTADTARYDRVIFHNDGDIKTADIPLTSQSGRVYYPLSGSSPCAVGYSIYRQMWRCDPEATATVYFTNTRDWSKVYAYYWTDRGDNTWPGTQMTYVRASSAGKGIYRVRVPADAKVIFTDGAQQTADIPCVADGFGYYPYEKTQDGKWSVVEYDYQ